jgi:3-hydroxybutyryl-CoA dehydratase
VQRFRPLDRFRPAERLGLRTAKRRAGPLRGEETEPIVAPPNRTPDPMSLTSPKPAVDPRMLKLLYFEDLHVGLREVLMKTVMDSDVVGFARLSGDENPIHLCDVYAAQTRFGQRIAHGLYTASLISAVLGTRLPGPGAVYRSQTVNFHAPVKIGDVVTVIVEVVELIPEGRRVRLKCEALVDGHMVLDGEAVVSVPRRPA